MKVWIDGAIVDGPQARIPVTDHGLLYGDGIFEGIRVYGGRIFRLADHLRRLATGARAIGLEIPGGVTTLEKIVHETARAYARDEAYVRLIVTRGEGELGVDPTGCGTPRTICILDRVRLYPEEKLEIGVDLLTSSVRRSTADSIDPRIKSLNYLDSVLAKREARLRGGDEALLLNREGRVAEASVANVFAVRDGALFTPPPSEGGLEGITRDSVLRMAADRGGSAHERPLDRIDLFGADEVFLTGTGARIVPVASLDGAPIGEPGHHPVASELSRDFREFCRAHGTRIQGQTAPSVP